MFKFLNLWIHKWDIRVIIISCSISNFQVSEFPLQWILHCFRRQYLFWWWNEISNVHSRIIYGIFLCWQP